MSSRSVFVRMKCLLLEDWLWWNWRLFSFLTNVGAIGKNERSKIRYLLQNILIHIYGTFFAQEVLTKKFLLTEIFEVFRQMTKRSVTEAFWFELKQTSTYPIIRIGQLASEESVWIKQTLAQSCRKPVFNGINNWFPSLNFNSKILFSLFAGMDNGSAYWFLGKTSQGKYMDDNWSLQKWN